jgi:hypothetical protein
MNHDRPTTKQKCGVMFFIAGVVPGRHEKKEKQSKRRKKEKR